MEYIDGENKVTNNYIWKGKGIMEERKIVKGIYKHFKGKEYIVLDLAEHTETREILVVYKALYGEYRTFVRPIDMFLSEVDKEKYPEVKQQYRFQLIQEIF